MRTRQIETFKSWLLSRNEHLRNIKGITDNEKDLKQLMLKQTKK